VVASFIFLGENPRLITILGTVCILLGSSIMLWKKHTIHIGRGDMLVLLAAAFYGLGYVNSFYLLRSYDAASFEAISNLLPALAIVLFYPKSTQ
jgi:drug/metabolite transporter (DMT)-like permease